MISSLLGVVIMSAATVAMLIAIRLSDETLNNVGKYPLTEKEIEILRDAGLVDGGKNIEILNQEISSLDFEKD
jgi:hypothetical protein